jgi:hypothetical protein
MLVVTVVCCEDHDDTRIATQGKFASLPDSAGQLCWSHGEQSFSAAAPEHGTLRRKYFLCDQRYSKCTKMAFLSRLVPLFRIQSRFTAASIRRGGVGSVLARS